MEEEPGNHPAHDIHIHPMVISLYHCVSFGAFDQETMRESSESTAGLEL